MSFECRASKSGFVRIRTEIPVRYKFLSKVIDLDDETVYEGATTQISGHGLFLVGKIPSVSWIPGLLMAKIVLGMNILLPSCDEPIKVLTRAAWVEAIEEGSEKCGIGLTFMEIDKTNQDEIMKYVIRTQLTS